MLGKTILTVSFIAGAIAVANYGETYLNSTDTNDGVSSLSSNEDKGRSNFNLDRIAQLPNTTQESTYTGIVQNVDNIARQITVRIATPDIASFGSGAIIARNGNTYYVATAKHVVQDKKQYQIITP